MRILIVILAVLLSNCYPKIKVYGPIVDPNTPVKQPTSSKAKINHEKGK